MPAAVSIRTEGVAELKLAFRAADAEYRKGIQVQLREIGTVVATEAKIIAAALGLVDTGKLIARINPGVQGYIAVVRDSANKHGFNYPAVYEGELSGHGLKGRGPRPFLRAAVDRKEPEILAGLESILDRVAAGF